MRAGRHTPRSHLLDNSNVDQEFGTSLQDLKHRLNVNVTYQLPFGDGRKWLNHGGLTNALLGGWQLAMSGRYQSGFPMGMSQSSNSGLLGSGQRPNVVPGVEVMTSGSQEDCAVNGWFNPEAFTVAPAFTFGNSPRVNPDWRGPSQRSTDLAISKFQRIADTTLQLRFDVLNLFNDPLFNAPNTTIGNINFGKITSVGGFARSIQIQVRLAFRQHGKTDLGFAAIAGYVSACESSTQSRIQRRSVMAKSTTIIAFDQHAATIVAAVLLPGQRTPALHSLTSDSPTILRFLKRFSAAAIRCCYEAGPCGFELQRALTATGVPCDVIAPALIPRRAGDRVKTDRRDASQLAILYRAEALTAIHIPTEQEEAARDLLRCREDIRVDLLRARHRLTKFLLRHGRRFTATKRARTKRHAEWLQAQRWPLPALEQTHRAYVRAVDEAVGRLESVNTELRDLLTIEPLRARVERLRCFRGIDDLTALTIAAELGDARRFPSASRVMAYTGLVPAEYSSGAKQTRGHITKTGNTHLRRVLVESAWHYRHHPFLGDALRHRQRGAPAVIIDQAWHAQQRLHRRYRRLQARGKPKQHIVTAIARELSGFLWAALTQ